MRPFGLRSSKVEVGVEVGDEQKPGKQVGRQREFLKLRQIGGGGGGGVMVMTGELPGLVVVVEQALVETAEAEAVAVSTPALFLDLTVAL